MRKIFAILLFLSTFSFAFEEINASNFKDKIKGQDAIVDFYAVWCSACAATEEHLVYFDENKNNKKVKIYKVNVDLNKDFALEHKAYSLPTILYIKNGEIVATKVGMQSYDVIEQNVKDYIKN